MPGIPGAVREGPLGVRRRKGVEPRYFVLFNDRLDYFYKEEEAASGAEPRGRLALSDIRRFEASEVELSFHLGSQTLVLSVLDGVELRPWIEDIRAMREAEAAPDADEIPWEEVHGRLPTSQEPEGRATRAALFERLDRSRSGGVPVAESERFLLERLIVRRLDSGGNARRVRLVNGLPPLEPTVHRAVDIASDVASHQAHRECDGLDRRGFHAALVYLRDYLELCALYKADVSAEVEVRLAAALVSQWGISDRVNQHYAGCKTVKFEDFADWLLWCKLMHSQTLDLDDPDDFPLHEAPHWARIEETAARRIQRAQRARQARGAGARAEEPPVAEAHEGEARAAEAEAAEAREAEARAAAAAAAEAREADARAAEAAAAQAREADAKAAEAREAEAREAELRAAEALEAEARAAEAREAEARAAEARVAEAREAEARAAEARAAEAREAEARAAEDRAVQALGQANEEAEEDATETEEADHDAGVLCQGPLIVERGGKSSRRHHVLFCDRICFYEDERDFFQGKDPRGSIALADVECVEEMGTSFQLLLKNSKSITEFQAESKEDTERWLHAWALVLQGNLGVSFARSKHKSVYVPPQPVVDDTSQADQPAIICEGSVDMMKKNKSEPRYFVLFERHFEYFNSQEEFGSGAPPRCRVALEDVQDVEVSSSGSLVIQLAQGKTFEMRARGREAARRWGRAWDKALSEGIFLAGAGTVSWGEGWEEEEEEEQEEEPRAAAAAEASLREGGIPDGGPSSDARAEVAEAAAEVASESWREPERSKREVSKQSCVTWDVKLEEERVLHEGVLVMGRGEDNLQPRFAVVLSDRLEYSIDWNTEAKASGPPRTRILRSQIRDAEVVDEGFNLELDDGVLLMRTSCEADQQAWLEALEAMLNDQEPSGQPIIGGPPINGHAPEPEPVMARPLVLMQETLGMECAGQVEQKHCVLYPDCLEYFSSLAEAESGARPHGVLWKKDFTSLEVLDSDLVLRAGDQMVVLCATDRASFLAWQKALLPLFGSGGDAPCWSRHAPAAEPPRPPLCQGAFLVSWGLGGVEAEEMVVLHPDRLECASGHVPTQEIEDVEVRDEGFVFHGRGGCRLSLRSADGAIDMEAWLSALGRVLDGDEAAADVAAPPAPPSLLETGSGSRGGQRAAGSALCRKLCRTSSDLAAGPTRCVHEGPLELEPWRGPRRPRHAVLYGNKLDLFGAAEEADGGYRPCLSVPVEHIQELRVLDLAFELRTFAASAPRQLRVPARRDFEEWLRAWGLVLGGGGMERRADGRGWVRSSGLGASRKSLPARIHRGGSFGGADQPRSSSLGRGADQPPRSASSGRGRWAYGRSATSSNLLSRGRILHQGSLALVRLGRTEAYHFVAYADRLEYFLDAAHASAGASRRGVLRPGDIREVRVLEHGFVLGMAREIIELHVASTRDMDVWVKVLRTVLDPAAAAEDEQEQESVQAPADDREEELEGMSSYFSQAPVEASCLGAAPESLDSGGALLAEWLDSLQEPPLHRGELGFQDRGRMTKRYCVLFRDRLDCWEAMSQVGSKPEVRIQLSDIRGLEIISSGFVLNTRGRRTGVHVSNNEELQVWTHALLSVLAPSESSEATTPATPQTSVPSTPSGTSAAPRPSRPRSAPQGGGGATQRASSARPSGLRSKSPSSPRLAPFVPRVANLTPSAASRGQSPQRQNSHQSSSRSLQHDSAASTREGGPPVKLGRPQTRETGGEWACREVASKIVEPAPGRSPLLQRKEERGSLAEKVTGRPAVATTRPRVEISGKITDSAEGARSQGATAAATRCRGATVGEAVALKVNEPGRVTLVTAKSVPAHGMTEKITQARGSRRPAATPPGRHMGQPLGLPGHAPGFLA